jgi:hypothetical protein
MKLATESYLAQRARWPAEGRHILAHYDDERVVVYQAYRPEIGLDAAANGRFGSAWSRSRMTWIKPNFLWMMFRCGWAQKEGQEIVLGISLARAGFDAILAEAVHSSFIPERYASEAAWKEAVASSAVRLQWDPDHDPNGGKVERRAIQLGLRGDACRRFADEWLLAIEDVTPFVLDQRVHATPSRYAELVMPTERVYPVADPEVAARLGVS